MRPPTTMLQQFVSFDVFSTGEHRVQYKRGGQAGCMAVSLSVRYFRRFFDGFSLAVKLVPPNLDRENTVGQMATRVPTEQLPMVLNFPASCLTCFQTPAMWSTLLSGHVTFQELARRALSGKEV